MEKKEDLSSLLNDAKPWFSYNDELAECFNKDILSVICFMDGNIFGSRYKKNISEDELTKVEEIIKNPKEYFSINNENDKLKILEQNLSQNAMLYIFSELLLNPTKSKKNNEIFTYLFSVENNKNSISMPIKKLNIPEDLLVEILEHVPGLVQFMLENKENDIEIIDGLIENPDNKKRLIFMRENHEDLTNSKIVSKILNGSYGIYDDKFIVDFLCERCDIEELLKNEKYSSVISPNIRQKLTDMISVLNRKDIYQTIDIPDNMKLGIEYEFFGNNLVTKLCDKYSFTRKGEKTIHDDFFDSHEAVSGILDKQTINNALNLADSLVETNHFVNNTCGFHVHIDSKFLNVQDGNDTNIEATKYVWKNFLEMWMMNEDAMYGLVNKSGDISRGNFYAKNMREKIQTILQSGIMEVETIEDLKGKIVETQFEGSNTDQKRYFSVNFSNLNYGQNSDNIKDTIEFRLANGTLDSNEIKKTILLYAKILEKSKEYGVLDYKISQNMQLTKIEKDMLVSRNKMREEQDDENRTEQFIKIMFSDEEMQREYIERYEKNCNVRLIEHISPTDLIELAKRSKTGKFESLSGKIKNFTGKLKEWFDKEKER